MLGFGVGEAAIRVLALDRALPAADALRVSPGRRGSASRRNGRAAARWTRLVLIGVSLAAALAAAELVLRRGAARATRHYVWEPSFERVFHPDPDLVPGVSGPSRFMTNALGLRGDELGPESDYRVLALGGSTTECLMLDQEEAWPQLVQTILNQDPAVRRRVWAANAGASGRHTRDHVVQLECLLPELPRIDCVVMLAGVNDLLLVLSEGERYDPDFMARPEARHAIALRAFRLLPLAEEERLAWYKRTALWRLGAQVRDRFFPSPLVVDGAGASIERWRQHRWQAPRVLDTLPDLAAGLREYRANLSRMVALVRAAGARPILATQPALWREDLEPELERRCWMGGIGDYQARPGATYYSVAALARGMAAYNRELTELACELDVAVVDLAAVIPSDDADFFDDVHFTEAGSRLVARAVAAEIARDPALR